MPLARESWGYLSHPSRGLAIQAVSPLAHPLYETLFLWNQVCPDSAGQVVAM